MSAGADQTISVANTTLAGSVTDDDLPFGTLEISWSQVSGPGVATFAGSSITHHDGELQCAGDVRAQAHRDPTVC